MSEDSHSVDMDRVSLDAEREKSAEKDVPESNKKPTPQPPKEVTPPPAEPAKKQPAPQPPAPGKLRSYLVYISLCVPL